MNDDPTRPARSDRDRARLVAAIEQASEGVALLDPEGNVDYVNPAFERMTGYTRAELVGSNLRMLASEEHMEQGYLEARWEALARGEPWRGRVFNQRKSGEPFLVESSITPIRDARGGDITGYVAIKRDVTVEDRLEQRLRQAQKMEALGTLAGGMAHDLNNMLLPIVVNTEIAIEKLGADDPIRELLERVLGAAHRGRDLVKQVLTFSRRADDERRPVALASIIGESLELLRSTLPPAIRVESAIDPDAGYALADPTQIDQVMLNLCHNAAYAMRETGGVLSVSLDACEADEESARSTLRPSPGACLRLVVRDTGSGMDGRTLERIFEPFFTTKSPAEGTGMGLAVVHGIVESHGGEITVESAPGEGSAFTVLLPRVGARSSP